MKFRRPVNRQSTEQRRARQQAIDAEGRRAYPRDCSGPGARRLWLDYIAASDLPPLVRLTAHTLTTYHGKDNGGNLYPGVRVLAAKSNQSPRTVSKQLELLILAGFLTRRERARNRGGASGFVYCLTIPAGLLRRYYVNRPWELDPNGGPLRRCCMLRLTVLTQRQHRLLTIRQHQLGA